jgi:Flp pilus assembly protein TadD
VWLLALSGASWVQCGYWRDSSTLFGRAVAVTEENWLAQYSLANERWREGALDEAERRFRKAIALNPVFADAYNNLGALLIEAGRSSEAGAVIERAVRLSPGDAQLHFNLGLALETLEPARAAREYREALRLRPGLPGAAIRLAIVQRRLGP